MSCTSVLSYTSVLLICIISTVLADICGLYCQSSCCSYNSCCDEYYCCENAMSAAEILGIIFGVIIGCIAIIIGLCLLCPFCILYKRRHNTGQVFSQGTQQPQTVTVYPPHGQQVWQQQQQQTPAYPVQQYYTTQPVQPGFDTTPGPYEKPPPYNAATTAYNN